MDKVILVKTEVVIVNTKYFVVLLFVFLVLFTVVITVVSVKRSNEQHNKNALDGTAVIVGYGSQSTNRDVDFLVNVIDSGYKKDYNLKGVYNVKKLDGSLDERYPHFSIGDEVKVTYSKKKAFGIEMLDVRIDRSQYDYPNK